MTALLDVGKQAGRRFQLVNSLPATALVVFGGATALSGGFMEEASLARLSEGISSIGVSELGLAVFAVFLVSLVVNSFQTRMVKWLEGYWRPVGLRMLLIERGLVRHGGLRRRFDLDKTTQASPSIWQRYCLSRMPPSRQAEFLARYRRWARDRAAFYPRRPSRAKWTNARPGEIVDRLMPTRLGNALRNAEDFAGLRYGLDAIRAVPYLLDVAGDDMRNQVDDAQTEIDVTAKLVYVWGLCTLIGLVAYIDDGPWLAVPVVTMVLSWASYEAAVLAAENYGAAIVRLVDLYRFDLMVQLHGPLPNDLKEERKVNALLWASMTVQSEGDEEFRYQHHNQATEPG